MVELMHGGKTFITNKVPESEWKDNFECRKKFFDELM